MTMASNRAPVSFVAWSAIVVGLDIGLLWTSRADLSTVGFVHLGSVILFILLGLVAEIFPLEFAKGKASFGFSSTLYWALLLVHGPFWAAFGFAVGQFLADALIRKRSIGKAIYNGAQLSLSLLVAGKLLVAVTGSWSPSLQLSFFLVYVLAVLTNWFTNTWLVSIGARFYYGESAVRFWRGNFQWAWIYELTSAPIAVIVAYAYTHLSVAGLLMVALPTLMVRLAYSQYLDLKRTYRETVRTLIKVIEMHDPYTAGHSDRVAHYARELCEALNLSPTETEKIELAAYLHDVGKIHLDLTGIVRKAGKLTEEERRLVRLHPVMSADLANQVSYFQGEIEAMIRHHHENWDGSGYPHGLSREEIPLGARVILLADSFDAMTTSRVYREALDIEFVKDEFTKFAGVQFDPELVPVFLDKVVRDGAGIVSKPIDEPMEGQRARAPEVVARQQEIRTIPRRGVM